MKSIQQLQQVIHYQFHNITFLEVALTHSSYANEMRHQVRYNERQEFLGDAVLSIIVSDYLFNNYTVPEGDLTKLRAALVCERSLDVMANKIGLGDYLRLGHGEEMTGGRTRPSIIADAFEALIAGIYLDGGLEAAQRFVLPFVEEDLTHEAAPFVDYKTRLQEIIQKNPARMIDLPLTRRTTQYIPSPVEIQKLLDALAKEPRHYRMFYLLSMCTGCRRGELCALKWEDFKFSRGGLLLTISRSRSVVPGKGVVEGSTKNGRNREIVLSSDIRGIFLSYRRRKQLEARLAHRELGPYLFTDALGQLIHPDTFTKRLRKIYESIGFPKEYHLHTLRHYYVTSLLHSGVDKQTVADLVGHADTGFLERTYCHPQQEQKEQAAGAMRAMLRPEGEVLFNLAAACPAKSRSA